LIGIDGSEHSYKALMKALELQKMSKSEVIVFHSAEHQAMPNTGIFMAPSYSVPKIYSIADPDIQRIKEVYEKNAQAIIDRAKEIFSEYGIEIKTRLIYDKNPVSYIDEVVKEEGIDLVIIGAKGTHSLLEEVLIGSVAEKVVRHIHCDILVIR
jgi:nucleotide-binding universal stress UspA family protein